MNRVDYTGLQHLIPDFYLFPLWVHWIGCYTQKQLCQPRHVTLWHCVICIIFLYYQGPETQQTSVRWSRPALPPLNPAQHALTFQQLDIDHYTGTSCTADCYELSEGTDGGWWKMGMVLKRMWFIGEGLINAWLSHVCMYIKEKNIRLSSTFLVHKAETNKEVCNRNSFFILNLLIIIFCLLCSIFRFHKFLVCIVALCMLFMKLLCNMEVSLHSCLHFIFETTGFI